MDKTGTFIIIFIIFIIAATSFSDYFNSYNSDVNFNNSDVKIFISKVPQLLGGTDYGNVFKNGPYGNQNAPQKIAFVVGVHPLEINSHSAMVQSILMLNESSNYCYYIYSVNVTRDRELYNEGRMNGQMLAYKFAVPDILQNNYDLVIDVHSNKGDNFKKQFFLYAPENEAKSLSISHKLISNTPEIVYYVPPNEGGPKSPPYVTLPVINSGKPAIIYETYRYDPYEVTLKHATDFIKSVEKLKLN